MQNTDQKEIQEEHKIPPVSKNKKLSKKTLKFSKDLYKKIEEIRNHEEIFTQIEEDLRSNQNVYLGSITENCIFYLKSGYKFTIKSRNTPSKIWEHYYRQFSKNKRRYSTSEYSIRLQESFQTRLIFLEHWMEIIGSEIALEELKKRRTQCI